MTLEINQTINQLVIQQTTGDTLEITTQGPQGPAGPSTTFIVAGNSGPSQTISNGDTLTLTSPVSFQQVVMSATDTATFSWPNQSGRVFLASPSDGSAGTPAFRAIVFADLDAVLGTMAQQDANAVAITGGTLDGVTIGGTTAGAGTFGILQANTSLTVASDTNATTILGRIRIDSRVSDTAYFSHFDMTTANNFALRQGATGATTLNTASGSNMLFAVDNSTVTTLSSGGLWIMGSGANTARLNVNAPASTIGAIIRANATGTANIQEWQDSSANILSFIGAGGPATFGSLTAGTNDTVTTLTIRRNSTGTPAANFASRTLWQLESSTTENRDAAALDVLWTTATDATRTSNMLLYTVSSGTLTLGITLTPTTVTFAGRITGSAGINIQSGGNSIMQDVSNSVIFQAQNSAAIPIIVRGRTSQSANLQEWQDSSATILSLVAATGAITAGYLDAGTNDTQTALTIRRNSSGTPAANFASQVVYQLESNTTENTQAAGRVTSWVVATHASRTARQVFNIYDAGGAREAMRLEASGSAAMIGFLGANAVIRQALGAWAGLTTDQKLDALRDALTNLGLTSFT